MFRWWGAVFLFSLVSSGGAQTLSTGTARCKLFPKKKVNRFFAQTYLVPPAALGKQGNLRLRIALFEPVKTELCPAKLEALCESISQNKDFLAVSGGYKAEPKTDKIICTKIPDEQVPDTPHEYDWKDRRDWRDDTMRDKFKPEPSVWEYWNGLSKRHQRRVIFYLSLIVGGALVATLLSGGIGGLAGSQAVMAAFVALVLFYAGKQGLINPQDIPAQKLQALQPEDLDPNEIRFRYGEKEIRIVDDSNRLYFEMDGELKTFEAEDVDLDTLFLKPAQKPDLDVNFLNSN